MLHFHHDLQKQSKPKKKNSMSELASDNNDNATQKKNTSFIYINPPNRIIVAHDTELFITL
jgi:hypothetical protein